MSKSDELRRMREARFAQRAPGGPPAPASVASEPASAGDAAEGAAPARRGGLRSGRPREATEEQGKCPACGKMRALQNGVLAVHQKGFGKVCPGSRQAPA